MNYRIFLLLGGLSIAGAQVYTPPANNNNNRGNVPPPPPRSSQNQNSSNNNDGSLYGNEIPFLDPGQETISVAGRTFPIADTRLLSARYEKYLNEPADDTEPFKEYRKLLNTIGKTISPLAGGEPQDKLRKAVMMLPKAALYEGDADQSTALTNAIHTAYISKADVRDKKKAMEELNEEKRRTIYNMSIIEKRKNLGNASGRNIKEKGSKANNTSQQARQNDVEYDYMGKRLLEIEALKKKYEGEGALSVIQSKLMYQSQLVHFALQRRFEHARIGCYAYNIIFRDGDSKLKLEKGSDASKVFGETVGMPPTVSTVETFANEAIRDTDRAVDSVRLLLKNKRLTAANKRLSEAYFVGEFLEPIRTFPLEDKQVLFSYIQDMRSLKSAMEGRDFQTARELVTRLKEVSIDFDSSVVTPLIEMAVQASNLHLMNAQQAMLKKDPEKAQLEVREAINIWPMNPMMKDLQNTLTQSSEVVIAKNDFERLLQEENYRQIFKDQYRFAPAIAGDAVLEDAFKQIITNITKIEASIGKANEFAKMGQYAAAWEELKRMHDQKTFSKDPELGNEIVRLSPHVSELARALENAKEREGRGEAGSALYWYIKARSLYPGSKYASEGIERLTTAIFTERSIPGSD